jgi:sugar lactone lactonase YvrE
MNITAVSRVCARCFHTVLLGCLASVLSSTCVSAQFVTFTGAQSTVGSGLAKPTGVALDGAGNVYIADNENDRVVKVPAGGGPQTIVATGFNEPTGVAVDAAGDVLVADFGNNRVVEIPAAGGSEFLVGGQLAGPTGVAVDSAGNIYIADSGHNRVVKAPVEGGQTTVGTGLNQPIAVAVDAAGDVFIADLQNNRVVKVPAGGGPQTTVGSNLLEPDGVAVDPAGDVFIVNYGGSTVVEVPAAGGSQIEIGSGWNGPQQIAVDGGGGIYVADGGNNRVVELQTKAVNFGSANVCPAGKLSPAPCYATVNLNYSFTSEDDVNQFAIYLLGGPSVDFELAAGTTCGSTTTGNTCVVALSFSPTQAGLRQGAFQFFDNHGNITASTSLFGTGMAPQVAFTTSAQTTLGSGLSFPTGVAMDGAGNVYIADSLHGRVVVLPAGGGTPFNLGSGGLPVGIALDGAGDLYISDAAGSDVMVATRGGTPTSVGAPLKSPFGIALDGRGDLFIADSGNNRVAEVPTGGGATISLGTGLSNPEGVAVDGSGNVFIADTGNDQVVEVPAVGGAQITICSGLKAPDALAVDAADDVFIADSGNNRVVEVPAGGGPQITIGSGLKSPGGIFVNSAGDVLIGDSGNNRVLQIPRSKPPALSFANATVATTGSGSPQTVGVENIGNQQLSLTGVSYPADFPIDFAASDIDNLCIGSTSLSAGEVCDLAVDFTPLNKGPLSEKLTLTDNVLNLAGTTQTIALTGTALETQTIVFVPPASVTYGAGPLNLSSYAAATSGLPVTLSLVSGPATIKGSIVTFTGAGSVTIKASQGGSADYLAGAPVQKTITIGKATPAITWAAPAVVTYGTALSATQLHATSTVPGTFAYTPAAGAVLPAGVHALSVIFTPSNGTNYASTKAAVALTVLKGLLTVTANNATITFGKPLPSFSFTVAGFANKETSTVLTGKPTETTTAKVNSAVGGYAIEIAQGTLKAANYTFEFENGVLSITPVGTAATPALKASPGAGGKPRLVTITDRTPGAVIHFTIDGSTPTAASRKYAGAFAIRETETIKAIAIAPGYTVSSAASEKYTIQ